MLTLGIETSGPVAGLALAGPEGILAADWFEHGQRLVPLLAQRVRGLLDYAGVSLAALEGIGVSAGPGSFTGIRIGVTFAKSLAYALERPVTAVDTLAAFAAEAPGLPPGERWVVVPGVRGEHFVGRFRMEIDAGLVEAAPGECRRTAELLEQAVALSGPAVVLPAADLQPELASGLGDRILWKTPRRSPQGDTIAVLARRQLLAGEFCPVHDLAPRYLRRSTPELRLEAKA